MVEQGINLAVAVALIQEDQDIVMVDLEGHMEETVEVRKKMGKEVLMEEVVVEH